jgi:hypothetical protein
VGGAATPAQTVTVFNDGLRVVHLGRATLVGPGAADYALTADGCSASALGLFDACDIAVAFRPGAAGSRPATLAVPSDDPNGPATVALAGVGRGAGGRAVTRPAVAARDRTAPVLRLRVSAVRLRRGFRGLPVRVTCSEACALQITLSIGARAARALGLPARGRHRVVIGRRRLARRRAGVVAVTVPFTRALRARLTRARRLDVRVTVSGRDPSGNAAKAVATEVHLRAARRR